MTSQKSGEASVWRGRAKALAAGLLLAAIAVTSLLPAAPRAHAADTFIVDQTADASDINVGDGDCDVSSSGLGFNCSLRAAIQEANANPGPDVIRFLIQDGTSEVKTLNYSTSALGKLPPITDTVTIDGYTQPGASPNTKAVGDDAVLKIRLLGTGARGGDAGLEITTVSGNCVIKGLIINSFTQGIAINGDSLNNRIEGNFLGINPFAGGVELNQGNAVGVSVFNSASQNTIGGTTPAARNVISGNEGSGIAVDGGFGNLIQNNYIGTNPGGTGEFGNANDGVDIDNSTGNVIGGTTPAARNVISGNGLNGVSLSAGADGNSVLGNRIGTTVSGTGALGNLASGVAISGSPDNSVGDGTAGGANTIAFNSSNGVRVAGTGSTGNAISRNSIFSNNLLGIDLHGGFESASFVTANDPGDIDGGPNRLQNFPVITSAKNSSTKTTIIGKLGSSPGKIYTIEFYSNPSGNEGKKFIGQTKVVTDDSGNASFIFSPAGKVAAGQTVTATATNRRNTSEFSAPKTVALSTGSGLSPETNKVSGPSGITNNSTAHFKFSSPDPDASFECSLDGGAYYRCSSPETINRLPEGRHTFTVRAVDAEGDADPSPAVWVWAVESNR
jgi:CSLREA domain-containing protein